jgi:hypothetical protein
MGWELIMRATRNNVIAIGGLISMRVWSEMQQDLCFLALESMHALNRAGLLVLR